MLWLPCAGSRLRRPRLAAEPRGPGAQSRLGLMARATCRGAEARGPKNGAIGPVIERLAARASGRHDRAAFRVRSRAARVGHALGADDRREREPGHGEAVRKYRRPEDYLAVPAGGAGAGHLRDGFLPSEGEIAERDDGDDARGVRRRGAASRSTTSLRLPGVARKTANVVSAELGAPQGIVVDTHVRRLSQRLGFTKQEDPARSSATSSGSCRARTGPASRTS